MSGYRQAASAAIRILSKPFLLLLACAVGAPSHAAPSPDGVAPQRQTLRAFFDELGADRTLRTRFARSPRDVLGERGLDLPGLALPSRLTEGEIDRLLKRWLVVTSASAPVPFTDPESHVVSDQGDAVGTQPTPGPPMPVYGPPAGPKRRDDRAPAPPRGSDLGPQQPGDGVPPSDTRPPTDRD